MAAPFRVCAQCGEQLPLNSDHFPVDIEKQSGFGGNCLECRPTVESRAKKLHPAKLKAMCTGKRAFNTAESARNVMINHALKHKGQRVRSYQCPVCEKWHLTTH